MSQDSDSHTQPSVKQEQPSTLHDTLQPVDFVAVPIDEKPGSESPPTPGSSFLCSSSISALLESATSLSLGVTSGGGKRSVTGDKSERCASEVSQNVNLTSVECAERLGNEHQEIQPIEVHLSLDNYLEVHNPGLPQLAPPILRDAVPTTPQPTLTVHPHQAPVIPSPLLNSPIRTQGEPSYPHISTDHPRHEHTSDRLYCSQISIPMDQIDEEGVCLMGVTPQIFPFSQRSSVALPANEGEVPHFNFYRRNSYQTHSRNVSETPSFPPFQCSSTSSAYHSRNSSLGSQFSSSCFESDSTHTDIDSCLALHTGCHSDLKHSIRLQDSRNSRGDYPSMSYTSEWNTRHHIHVGGQMGLSNQSPSIEETLQNIHVDSLEEREKLATLKSSEWIKRQLSMSRESLVQVKVSSKNKHVVHFNVRAGDIIVWEFATKKKDIAFAVLFEATQVAMEQPEEAVEDLSPEDKVVSILPMFRMNTHTRPVFGTHIATQDGVYEIIFDNTYSRFFAKELFYRITTQPVQSSPEYSQQ